MPDGDEDLDKPGSGGLIRVSIVRGGLSDACRASLGHRARSSRNLDAVIVQGEAAGRLDPPSHEDGNHCVNAFGVDLNAVYGVPVQIRMFDCQVISAGEHWIRPIWWITNTAADSVYQGGYVPAQAAPLNDFVSKLTAVKFVIDGGTRQERSYIFRPSGIVRTDIDAEELEPGA